MPNDKIPLTYDRHESIKYFGDNDSTKKSGPKCLVGMDVYNTTSAYTLLDDDDILLHLLITKCVTSLTRNQRVKFGFILEMIRYNVTKKEI